MTISVLFLSITIQRNKISKDEMFHNEQIEKAMNDVKERQALYCDHMQFLFERRNSFMTFHIFFLRLYFRRTL